MRAEYLWTKHLARLQFINSSKEGSYNWLFLPGGPGLGSEYLHSLTSILKLPGTTWHLDLPGDGSNTTLNNRESIQYWPEALLEATGAFKNVILVGHSRGAMFALAKPEIEQNLTGFVLMDAAPDMSWHDEFNQKIEPSSNESAYQQNPSNATLRDFILAGTPFMFTKEGLEKGIKLLKDLPYNYEAIQWTEEHFDPTYKAKWVPQNIPTLIFSGEKDLATPLKFFAEKKAFNRQNILMKEIKNAAHFPWIENPQGVISAFEEYIRTI